MKYLWTYDTTNKHKTKQHQQVFRTHQQPYVRQTTENK